MLKQKIQNLLIVVLIVIVVILSSFLMIGLQGMMVRAQSEVTKLPAIGSVITGTQSVGIDGANQDVDTKPLTPGGGAGSPLEVVSELQRGDLGTGLGVQSTGSGGEYIPSAAFRHDGVNGPASGYRFWPTAGYVRNNSASLLCVGAPVYVPHGATITEFTMFFVDDHATLDMWQAYLRRNKLNAPPGTSSEDVMDLDFLFGSNIDESIPFFASSSIINTPSTQNVSNDYAYSITFCFDANSGLEHLLYGFYVEYTQ